MREPESFGHWLKRQRTSQALTQVELARLVGCAVVTLRKIEADLLRPSQQIAARFVEALGISAREQPELLAIARGEPPTRNHNLPTPLTALLGRDTQIAAVCGLLRGDTRLLTLTGPGGIGKTRLAIQVATSLLGDFADGARFVDLAPLRDPHLVLPTIANVLHVREQSNQPLLDLLAEELYGQQVLLVLDNLEQLLPSAAQIAALLLAVPGLKVLVTSRAMLHLAGEYVFTVPPLELPTTVDLHMADTNLADRLGQSPAVALFMARAQAAAAGFVLTAANAPSVAAICMRLDGLPLAIELAAARSQLFAPAALLARLEQRLSFLTHGAQDLPARQQTLRATLDWSHALLGAAERALFRRLAVFSSGCTLEAAEAIVGTESDLIPADTMPTAPFLSAQLDRLVMLLDHSLISQQEDANGEPRFGMLETIHEYALEQLIESGELPALQARHSAYYVAFAEAAAVQLEGAQQTGWLHQLDAEYENLRAVFTWNLSPSGDPEHALRLSTALGRFWILRRFFREGHTWLTAALEAAPQSTPLRAWALDGLGWMARRQGDMVEAAQHFEASLTLFRALGDHRGAMYALRGLGGVAFNRGSYAQATVFMSESLALARALGDAPRTAWALLDLGQVAHWDLDFGAAQRLFTESLDLFRTLNMPHGAGWALWCMAETAKDQHEYPRAISLLTESQALFRQIDDPFSIALTISLQASIAQAQGDNDRALECCAESRSLLREQEDKTALAQVLITQGLVAELRDDVEGARTCYEESRQLYTQADDQRGKAQAILRLSSVAMIEDDGLAAHALLEIYTILMQDLGHPRMPALGACLRDAALAGLDERQSIALLEDDLAQFRVAGDQWGVCFALRVLGQVLISTGADAHARQCAREGLALASTLDDHVGILIQLAGLATIALSSYQVAQAAQLCGMIEAMQMTLGTGHVAASMWPPDRAQYAYTRDAILARLSDTALAAAWVAGQALSTTKAVAVALAFTVEHQRAIGLDKRVGDQEAARATSDHILRDQLPQTFLTLELEQAGAQSGALLLATGNDLMPVATAPVEQRQLHATLQQAINVVRRHDHPLAVIILEIDYFKHVNDTFGHAVGDMVLVEVRSMLRQQLRMTDIFGRWGGEEFIIVAPKTDREQASLLAERLRATIPERVREQVGAITISLGAAIYRAGDTAEALVKQANAALQLAKQQGSNRVEIALEEAI